MRPRTPIYEMGGPTRVNWEHLIDERLPRDLQRQVNQANSTEGGHMVHEWIQDEFEDELPGIEFEGDCRNGRYDAYDGVCVYEFKTKHPNVFDHGPPYERDIDQVRKYLDAKDMDADFGILVYLNRGDLTEVDEYLVNGSVVSLDQSLE